MADHALSPRGAAAPAAVLLALSSESAGALRALLRTETIRVDQWVRGHQGGTSGVTLETMKAYLEQLRSLRHEVEASIGGPAPAPAVAAATSVSAGRRAGGAA